MRETREGYITSVTSCPRCGRLIQPEDITLEDTKYLLSKGHCCGCETRDKILASIAETEAKNKILQDHIRELNQHFIDLGEHFISFFRVREIVEWINKLLTRKK